MKKPDWMCHYFALCDKRAEGIVELPWGSVPTCSFCADKMEQELLPFTDHDQLTAYDKSVRAL